jgi:hypothetical protein
MGIDGAEIKRRKEKLAVLKLNSPKANIYIAAAAIIIGLVWMCASNTSTTKSGNYSSLAFIQCQAFVLDRLKSPSTADFPFADYTSWKSPADKYIIKSYVDSQNGFGAMTRSHWHCETTYTPGDQQGHGWKLVKLEITQ